MPSLASKATARGLRRSHRIFPHVAGNVGPLRPGTISYKTTNALLARVVRPGPTFRVRSGAVSEARWIRRVTAGVTFNPKEVFPAAGTYVYQPLQDSGETYAPQKVVLLLSHRVVVPYPVRPRFRRRAHQGPNRVDGRT